jgi:microcystin-dependent protein
MITMSRNVTCVLVLSSHVLLTSAAPAIDTGFTGGGQGFDNRQPSIALTEFIDIFGLPPPTGGPPAGVAYMGTVRVFAGAAAPGSAWMPEGDVISFHNRFIPPFSDWCRVLGSTYGGNGSSTVALPDLRGRAAIHAASGGAIPLGGRIGADVQELTAGQMPAHHHTAPGGVTSDTGGGSPFDNRQASLGLRYIIATDKDHFTFPSRSSGAGPGTFLGKVALWAGQGAAAPLGWDFAEGQLVPIWQNTWLYSLLGLTYGGDGKSTFALPDFRGRVAVGVGPSSNTTLGEPFGSSQPSLAFGEMPSHNHTLPGGGATGGAGGNQGLSNAQDSLGIHYIIALQGADPGQFTQETYLGEIAMFAGNFAPAGWAFCDGQFLPIAQNPSLFAVLGATYGGDGVNTFALPNLQDRVVLHDGASPLTLGQKVGLSNFTPTEDQLPGHNHTLVPEPPTLACLGVGALALVLVRLRRCHRRG